MLPRLLIAATLLAIVAAIIAGAARSEPVHDLPDDDSDADEPAIMLGFMWEIRAVEIGDLPQPIAWLVPPFHADGDTM